MTDFTRLTDLASERLGGRVITASDEFFGPKEALVRAETPIADPQRYTDRGKWVDGWETRRRRDDGHDWCVIELGAPGVIRGIDVDTAHFLGNHAPVVSLEATSDLDGMQWTPILDASAVEPGSRNPLAVSADSKFTHVRLNIHPDGGVARLRVYGEPRPDWSALERNGSPIDLASARHGGLIVSCSDEFFCPPTNLLLPCPPQHMGDGWETRRRRGPSPAELGHDWCVIRLARRACVELVEIDTTHFKGNHPDRCSLDRLDVPQTGLLDPPVSTAAWQPLLEPVAIRADAVQRFPVETDVSCTHVRFNMHPDGGVSRLHLFGQPARDA